MAKIHKGAHSLNKQAWRYLIMSGVCWVLIVACVFAFINSGAAFAVSALYNIVPLLCLVGAFFYYRKYKNFRAGAAGEKNLLAELRHLPNAYHVFTNFVIKGKGFCDEIDFIVVGETGVFVIEAKNYCGQITGQANDLKWQQRKLVKGGKQVVKTIFNPVKQAARHTFNIARLLKNNGITVYVNGILAFTSPYVQLTTDTNDIFIVEGCSRINAAILNHRSAKKMDKNIVKDIVRVLSKLK